MKSFNMQFFKGLRVINLVVAVFLFTTSISFCRAQITDDPRLKAPWVASVFHKNPSSGDWDYICGGTITSAYTVITSSRCILSKLSGAQISSQQHYNYDDLQVVAGLKSNNINSKDQFTQFGQVGQVRDLFSFSGNPNTPYKDLAGIRLKTRFNLTTPYVKDVLLTEQSNTITEANATRPGNTVIVAGFERAEFSDGIKTRSQTTKTLQIHEIILTDIGSCIDYYTGSYDAYYMDVVCGKSKNPKEPIPCRYEGAGMVARAKHSINSEPNFYLFGVYSSNTALAYNSNSSNQKSSSGNCTSNDVIFFTTHGHLNNWAISHQFCDNELAMCLNNKCRPWSDLCNGSPECEDKSDETVQMCQNQKPCPISKFRCNYGACVDKLKVCNGIIDCVDQSDEDAKMCTSKGSTPAKQAVAGCPLIPSKTGVSVQCTHPDRKDPFSCTSFPVPVGTSVSIKRNEIRAICTKDGIWSQNLDLKC